MNPSERKLVRPNVRYVTNLASLPRETKEQIEFHKNWCFCKHILHGTSFKSRENWIKKQARPEYWREVIEMIREREAA